ncbi:MAG: hypothetical protein SGARI_000799, partial [Bacillariaceae sp.]
MKSVDLQARDAMDRVNGRNVFYQVDRQFGTDAATLTILTETSFNNVIDSVTITGLILPGFGREPPQQAQQDSDGEEDDVPAGPYRPPYLTHTPYAHEAAANQDVPADLYVKLLAIAAHRERRLMNDNDVPALVAKPKNALEFNAIFGATFNVYNELSPPSNDDAVVNQGMTAALSFSTAERRQVRTIFVRFMMTKCSWSNSTYLELFHHCVVMLVWLQARLAYRSKIKKNGNQICGRRDMKKNYIYGTINLMVLSILHGPGYDVDDPTSRRAPHPVDSHICLRFKLRQFPEQGLLRSFIMFGLVHVGKRLFGVDLVVPHLYNDTPKLFYDRIKAQIQNKGIYSAEHLKRQNALVTRPPRFGG